MMFGLCNAPATFQTFMDTKLATAIATKHIIVYLDDILIFAATVTELTKYMHMVFKLLQKLDLFL